MNVSDNFRLLERGEEVATAHTVLDVLDEPSTEVKQIYSVSIQSKSEIPDHLIDLYERSCKLLFETDATMSLNLLMEYQDIFAQHEFDLGSFTDLQHCIDTRDAKPVRLRIRRTPAHFVGEEEAHLKKMLKAGIIQESNSDWAAAPVLIRKRDGSVRWCIDYRKLNDVTVKDVFPLPLVDDCLDTLAGNTWFTKLDANAAYWQVGITEEERKKTAFHTKYGLFEHVRWGLVFVMPLQHSQES